MIKIGQYDHKYVNNGVRLPSVTTILGVVAKPQLIAWANQQGLNGINIKEDHNATDIGTVLHAYIEGYLTNQDVDDSGITEQQKNVVSSLFLKFTEWHDAHETEFYGSEVSLTGSEYGGTIDAIMQIDGKWTIMDWKTSKAIQPDYFSQISAYHRLFSEEYKEPEIEQFGILLLPKEDDRIEFKTISVGSPEFDKAHDYFQACLNLYKAKRNLKF